MKNDDAQLKRRLTQACFSLMASKGIKGFSLDEIARDLGISKKTIYQAYESKEDLVWDMVSVRMGEIEQETNQILTSNLDPFEKTSRILNGAIAGNKPIINSIDEMRRMYPQVWERLEQWRTSLLSVIVEVFKTGIAEGTVSREANIETAARIILTVTIFNMEEALRGKKVNIENVIAETIKVVQNGIKK